MSSYGVGVFGIGWVAGEHIRAYMRNSHMRVVALASRFRGNDIEQSPILSC